MPPSGTSGSDTGPARPLTDLLMNSPIPPAHLVRNLALYQRRDAVADTLALNEIYLRILRVPGVLMEFGTQWGRRLAVLAALRETYEPYDYTRVIVGFDTFEGFPDPHDYDGSFEEIHRGGMAVTPGYEEHLAEVLRAHDRESHQSDRERFELRRGDVRKTLPDYLVERPETIVGLAYFDLDLYEPTKACLEIIRPRLVPGSVLAFDQLGHRDYPGETVGFLESLGVQPSAVEKLNYSRSPTLVTI
ncbi:CalS11 [Actinoplanes friuliensis DSM 7358]|uniref:CalS11 n=2 Tax=Actinoplanes friuliensis TaxID=196914 RepID=U5W3P5_9ACTN|nr:CalS11 [Actinoplanes friuliensis DSM 7358]